MSDVLLVHHTLRGARGLLTFPVLKLFRLPMGILPQSAELRAEPRT